MCGPTATNQLKYSKLQRIGEPQTRNEMEVERIYIRKRKRGSQ
jgi:hypothetical protein